MKAKTLLAMGLLGLSGPAWAQGCPAGIPSAGNPACIPPDRENSPYYQGHGGSNRSAAPRAIWADRWGAIAFDNTNGGVGMAASMSSKRKAEKAAMAQCRAKGGQGCWIELAYHNQCAAIAWGSRYATTASAATAGQASTRAIETCSQKTDSCKVVYSDCSIPERIQ